MFNFTKTSQLWNTQQFIQIRVYTLTSALVTKLLEIITLTV